MITVTYYLDVISSWCYYCEPGWAELKQRYASVAKFDWRVAVIPADNLPPSVEANIGYYKRSGTVTRSQTPLNPNWLEPELGSYIMPNAVVEAARDLGITGDEARLAVTRAALQRGEKVGRLEVAAHVVAEATGLDEKKLAALANSEAILQRVEESSEEFLTLGVDQRPCFILRSEIGDTAIFSGLVRMLPIAAAMDAMLEDVRAYRSWHAHFDFPR